MLEFLARGRALTVAAAALDDLLAWEVFGAVPVAGSRIPHRQIAAALGLAADAERRRAIEAAHLEALDEQRDLQETFLNRYREGIAELGYGTHVQANEILGNIDLGALARDGDRFLETTEALYFELLEQYLPRLTNVATGSARAGDVARLEAAAEFDGALPGGETHRRVLAALDSAGLDPLAEGRIQVDWEAYLGSGVGAVCHAFSVPEDVRLAVSTRSGRPALATFLASYGQALHHGYTDPSLSVEQRRMGDGSVVRAAGGLFESLGRDRSFLVRVYDFPQSRLEDFRRVSALCLLLRVRSDIVALRYTLAHFDEGGDGESYAERMREVTGFEHDPREAIWRVDPGFGVARRLRGAQLAAVHAGAVRSRYDEDWYRNPKAGAYFKDLFANGQRYTAQEIAVQLGAQRLNFDVLAGELEQLV